MSRTVAASFGLSIAVLLLAVPLGGCEPPPRGALGKRPNLSVQGEAVIAMRGDTVYKLSRRYNISVRGLIEANGLRPPYHLYPGQTIFLPVAGEHLVVAGDTASTVAQRYDLALRDLARANNLSPPYVIRIGQRLRLPIGGVPAPAVAEQRQDARGVAGPVAAKAERAEPAPPPPRDAAAPTPPPDRKAAPAPTPPPVRKAAPAPPPPAREAAAAPPPIQKASVAVAPARPSKPTVLPDPPPLAGGFIWPAKGKVIARFGPLAKGRHNDGINIALPLGAPVEAAADGVVAYAGNELRGFGNLLLIKHADGWISAYAHNRELLVSRGAVVKRGQTIARAGATGSVGSPQLHFELRKGARAVDPLRHLPAARAEVAPGAAPAA